MMNRLAWLRGSIPRANAGSELAGPGPDPGALELANLQDAMISVDKIMDDDIAGAELNLKKGNSAFHSLGVGLTTTMRSILGFEKEIMNAASQRLSECEATAWTEMRRAQREDQQLDTGRVYPPGSEYALVQAEAQLMGAMIAVLHESLTEGIKGFYKLRKAFLTLSGIVESKNTVLNQRGTVTGDKASSLKASMERERMPGSLPESESDDPPPYDSEEMEFVDAAEGLSSRNTPARYEGHLDLAEDVQEGPAVVSTDGNARVTIGSASEAHQQFDQGPAAELFTDPVDAFVHSGANMCFGILLLMISMVPPAFSRLLSIIGFRGDRERGIRLLWQSTRFDNINGALAGLVLLGYYNGLLGFSDILPSEADVERGCIVGYPRERCAALLVKMRKRYPESRLWRLEEARQLSTHRDLKAAIDVLSKNTDSKMRQVAALNSFELSLDTMFVGNYGAMRDNFLKCLDLNDWSHAFYYYLAGCAELEIYRDCCHTLGADEATVLHHRRKAEELIRKAPTVAGRKKFMSKPMPLEQFISRKIQKWEERSKRLGLDFVDAVGASPVQEIVYMWNGAKKMGLADLHLARKGLDWGRLTATREAAAQIQAEIDEAAVVDVCLAAIYRNIGQCDKARTLLDGVIQIDRALFKGPTRDDYALPAAHYEMAALTWAEIQRSRGQQHNLELTSAGDTVRLRGRWKDDGEFENWQREKTNECFDWLDKVSKWETFVLDARIGMRVQTGKDTIRWFREEEGWVSP